MAVDVCPTLADLDYLPYADANGLLPSALAGKIGAYAIFGADRHLQYVGYSRDVYLSLKQHLVRQPHQCHWFKVQTIERPSRSVLESMRQAWIAESGVTPVGNQDQRPQWEQAIDVKAAMTAAEMAQYQDEQLDDRARRKVLKQAARRLEADILAVLAARGIQEPLRFNPKLKDNGLLDLK